MNIFWKRKNWKKKIQIFKNKYLYIFKFDY